MKINLIIGAGQLGSRHMQGLLRLEEQQELYILDPSEQSLGVARQRALEVPHNHILHFTDNWDDLPKTFDLVIIATGANVRAKLVTQLLENFEVKHLILEKILFQDLASYAAVRKLIAKTNTPTWVNHPRRMAKYFNDIKDEIAASGEKVIFHTVGSNWGLACSALHFIDLCAFLTNAAVATVNMDWIDDVIHESKRGNCIEFTGSVSGKMNDGSSFVISSQDGELGDIAIFVTTNSNRWIILEGRAQKVIRMAGENAFNEEVIQFQTEFQSTLSGRIAHDIFETGTCNLPTYDQACASHIPFMEAALLKYNQLSGNDSIICPIT